MRIRRGLAAAAAIVLVAAGTASANVPLTRVSADPFTNATSQHATEVEPDTFASGIHGRGGVPGRPLLQRGSVGHRVRPLRGRRRSWGPRASCPGSRSTLDVGVREPVRARSATPSVAYDAGHATRG